MRMDNRGRRETIDSRYDDNVLRRSCVTEVRNYTILMMCRRTATNMPFRVAGRR